MRNPRTMTLAGLAVGALLLTGCTIPVPGTGQAPGGNQPAGQATNPNKPEGGVLTANPKKQGAEAVGIDLSNPPAAIASVKAPYAGKERITDVTVELIELRKREKVLYGIFRVTNAGDFSGERTLYNIMGGNGWEPSLLDTTNLKEYRPITELSSRGLSGLQAQANQPLYVHTAWGYPEGAQTIDIRLDAHFPLLEGIAVP